MRAPYTCTCLFNVKIGTSLNTDTQATPNRVNKSGRWTSADAAEAPGNPFSSPGHDHHPPTHNQSFHPASGNVDSRSILQWPHDQDRTASPSLGILIEAQNHKGKRPCVPHGHDHVPAVSICLSLIPLCLFFFRLVLFSLSLLSFLHATDALTVLAKSGQFMAGARRRSLIGTIPKA